MANSVLGISCRVISTVLETDAYLLFKWFHPGYTKVSHSDFTESVDEALLTSKRTLHAQQQDSHEKFPHNIAPLSLHPLYDKDSASCVAIPMLVELAVYAKAHARTILLCALKWKMATLLP